MQSLSWCFHGISKTVALSGLSSVRLCCKSSSKARAALQKCNLCVHQEGLGCCSLTFLLIPAFILLGGVCSESSLHLQLPLGALREGRGELSQTLQVLWSKVKYSWDYNRERRMWGKSCRSVVKSLIAVRHSVLESSFCAGFGDLDLSGNQKVERAVSLWLLICWNPPKDQEEALRVHSVNDCVTVL